MRQTVRGGSADRAGMSNAEIKIHTLLDGSHALTDIARQATVASDLSQVTGTLNDSLQYFRIR